jgi:hypothetical protein
MKRLADSTGSSVPCAGTSPVLGLHISGNRVYQALAVMSPNYGSCRNIRDVCAK